MPTFNNLNDLLKHIKKNTQEVLETKVAENVKEKLIRHVESDIYSYKPKKYVRHYEIGELGLGSPENVVINPIENGVEIVNITEHDGKYIPYVVETGVGYDYTGYGYEYENPRPFVKNTKEELERTGEHIEILKKELKNKNFII